MCNVHGHVVKMPFGAGIKHTWPFLPTKNIKNIYYLEY